MGDALHQAMSTQIQVLTWAPVVILCLPLLTFLILLIGGRKMDKGADYFAIGLMGLAFLASVLLFFVNLSYGGADHAGWSSAQARPFVASFDWMQFGNVRLPMGVLVDNLSSFMAIVVTGLATLVLIYSIFYMHGDSMYRRYFGFMGFFCFAMLGIVFSSNLLMTFIFWELVGLGSYFLIGFWFHKPSVARDHHYQELKASYATGIDERYLSPAHAQKKAFVMNRIGDFGFITGVSLFLVTMLAVAKADPSTGFNAGPLDWTNLYAAKEANAFASVQFQLFRFSFTGIDLLTLAGILTFMGAIGKSAQFPLHTWLPDAMQGPTTGSSIIHAATMVAAGVYLTARIHPLLTEGSLFFVAMIGGITAFLAASMAMVQWDLKAVLAYSTISQLGYMMLGLGSGSYTAGVAHLYTHAIFKCMLFLCAGSVIHACHHLQDMNRMGGLRKKMPLTFIATCAGVLAISGVPLFSGFYSKDMILASALSSALDHGRLHWAPYILGQLTAALTTFYMCRMLFWSFFGTPRDKHVHEHCHESPAVATGPLLILAVLCLGFWWSGTLFGHTGQFAPLTLEATVLDAHGKLAAEPAGWIDAAMVSPVQREELSALAAQGEHAVHEHHHRHHTAHIWATGLSLLGVLLGAGLAWAIYGLKKLDPDELLARHPATLGLAWQLCAQLWFFDRLYQDGIVPLAKRFNRAFYVFDFGVIDQTLVDGWSVAIRIVAGAARNIDNWVVDKCVDAFGVVTWLLGAVARTLQAGRIQYYVALTFGAVAVLLLALLLI
ncbi:MAG: proton-conducting transporter membrane subunit [Planctomycetota bacterium]|nr:proton-conducting transporter membrane subunit [Planctomycetota bacterium]